MLILVFFLVKNKNYFWFLLVLGARVLVIKFIQFRGTFRHYIQFLKIAGLRPAYINY